jgi:phospholipid N-methyltransferase
LAEAGLFEIIFTENNTTQKFRTSKIQNNKNHIHSISSKLPLSHLQHHIQIELSQQKSESSKDKRTVMQFVQEKPLPELVNAKGHLT